MSSGGAKAPVVDTQLMSQFKKAGVVLSDHPSILDDVAHKLKVCGHPVRLKLLCLISRSDDPCVSELWSCLNLPQPVISQHLSVLKDRGIVESHIDGNRRLYTITDPFVAAIITTLQNSPVPV